MGDAEIQHNITFVQAVEEHKMRSSTGNQFYFRTNGEPVGLKTT